MTDLVPMTLDERMTYAKALAPSDLLPKQYRGNPANVLIAVEYGRALGLEPMVAINGIHVVEGKPTASAQLIGALVRKAGHRLRVAGDDRQATAVIIRADDPDYEFTATWTIDRAKQAGLTGKGVWKQYPAAMLKARAITEVARDACPEALAGVAYTAEEIQPSVPARATVVDTTRLHPTQPQPPEQVDTETGEIVDADLVDDPEPQDDVEDGDLISDPQMRLLQLLLKKAAIDRDDAHAYAEEVIGHPVASAKDLTRAEASQVIDHLQTAIGEGK